MLLRWTMPKRTFLLCLLLFSLSLAATAERQKDDPWHKEFALTGAPDLRVMASDANLRVTTWDQKRVDVTIRTQNWTIGDRGFVIREYQTGDRVEIDAPSVARCVGVCVNFSRRAEIEIRVPREGRFELS